MIRNPRDRRIFNNASMAQQQFSTVIDLTGSEGYAVQASWSGVTGTGTLTLYASSDDLHDPPQNMQWTQVSSSQFTVSTASGNDMWNVTSAKYSYAQLVWTPNAGATGTLNAKVTVK